MNHAAQAYASTARTGLSGRALEAAVLTRCATDLQRSFSFLPDDPEPFIAALERNRRAWSVITDDVIWSQPPLPPDVGRNIRLMAAFIFTRTAELAEAPDPARATILLEHNRTLAEGLDARPR
jgi:flagellar protein FlaF